LTKSGPVLNIHEPIGFTAEFASIKTSACFDGFLN